MWTLKMDAESDTKMDTKLDTKMDAKLDAQMDTGMDAHISNHTQATHKAFKPTSFHSLMLGGDAAAALLHLATTDEDCTIVSSDASDAQALLSLCQASVSETAEASMSEAPHPSTALMLHAISKVIDEHTPVVLLAKTQLRGSTLVVEAGAGAGKTTLAECIIHACKLNRHGDRQQILATTMTKAGVNSLKGRADIPSSMVKSLHGLGFHALCTWYVRRIQPILLKAGLLFASDLRSIRNPQPHQSKYKHIMQVLMPPTDFDKEALMHAAAPVSAAYQLMHNFVSMLADKAMEGGLGQVGQKKIEDVVALRQLCTRYELQGHLEKDFIKLSAELQPLCNRAVVLITSYGPGILGDSFNELKTAANTMALERMSDVTPSIRLHAAILMTSLVLQESIKVATQPGWRGNNCFTNALDPKDIMQLPALTFPEMVALPANTRVLAPVVSRAGQPYDVILIDEAQDSNEGQVGLITWAMSKNTQLIVIGDPLQRCFSFAGASSNAFRALTAPRSQGSVDHRLLLNNFRSARLVCDEIQKVLIEDVESDRIVRPTRTDHGEVIRNAHLRDGRLVKWLAEGTVAILARLNAVLAAFQAHFLKIGQPFAILGRDGVLPHLLRVLDRFPDTITLSRLLLELNQMGRSLNSSVDEKDHILCVRVFATSLLEEGVAGFSSSAKQRLSSLIEKAYIGSANADDNAGVRGMPILGSGHSSKGHEFKTVILAEPGLSMIQGIIDRGGEEADDEKHLKYVLVSRARDRLVFLQDVFGTSGCRGIAELCQHQSEF